MELDAGRKILHTSSNGSTNKGAGTAGKKRGTSGLLGHLGERRGEGVGLGGGDWGRRDLAAKEGGSEIGDGVWREWMGRESVGGDDMQGWLWHWQVFFGFGELGRYSL